MGVLQHPEQVWKGAQGAGGVARRRAAVGILADQAASMGPLPKAELAHRAKHRPEQRCMDSLCEMLQKMEIEARKYRQESRPLLDDGDGKSTAEILVVPIGAEGADNEGARMAKVRRRRRGRGRTERRALDTKQQHMRGFDKVSFRVNSRGSPLAAAKVHAQKTTMTTHMDNSGATPDMDNPRAKLDSRPKASLELESQKCARSVQWADVGSRSETRVTNSVVAHNSEYSRGKLDMELREPNPKSHQLYDGSNQVHSDSVGDSSDDDEDKALAWRRREMPTKDVSSNEDPPGRVARLSDTHDTKDSEEADTDHDGGLPGLAPPTLDSGDPVTGADKERHRKENKRRRQHKQSVQPPQSYWATHGGKFQVPPPKQAPSTHRGSMCPSGLALHHPAADLLLDYASGGCPANTGRPWTVDEMQAAIDRGPHVSALEPDAVKYMKGEIQQKVAAQQLRVVKWDDIKNDPPPELKISPVALIPHKSRDYRAILDLSFSLRLESGQSIPSVNEASEKTAPRGAIDQMGHALKRVIYAMADADLAGDDKVFMAKWDIKDGFWRLDCRDGEEWNFAYVLPQEEGEPVRLVVPTSLQMGWIESPPYFCAASETARDVAQQYAERAVGDMPTHKFLQHTATSAAYADLPAKNQGREEGFKYMIEVYVDDFISLARATSQAQLDHVANSVMTGVHDVFPEDKVDKNDPLSLKKLLKEEGMWDVVKNILGFTFDGDKKAMWLEDDKRNAIITVVHGWIRHAKYRGGIPFEEFESIIAKVRHAFTAIPAGNALLSPCNRMLRMRPSFVYLHRNQELLDALVDIRSFLRESVSIPTLCRELVPGHPDYIGVKDASGHGVGGIIVGENMPCPPTVFRMPFSQEIRDDLVSFKNRKGRITNSDLEFAGLLLLWLIMEDVCKLGKTPGCHVGLYSDNTPTVHWVQKLASRSSKVAMQLLRCLAFRLKIVKASPLTPLHVAGVRNALTDIPSRSFGSEPQWLCETDAQLLTLFNKTFPLPNQASWQVYRPSKEQCTRVISVLQMRRTTADEWQRPPKPGKVCGATGSNMSHLWDWTLSEMATHHSRIRSLLGFATRDRTGFFG